VWYQCSKRVRRWGVRIEPKTSLREAITRLLVVIKVDLFAKLLDITTHDEISGHA